MSIDLSQLENVHQRGEKTIARCPACAEQNHDEKGEHLIIQPDGRFGCVACPGIAGKSHRQRIYALVGDSKLQQRLGCRVRVHRPDHVRLPKISATVVDLAQLGTLGTGFSNP